jgi:two-component system sensor histidine kinase PilS (NtrC family)
MAPVSTVPAEAASRRPVADRIASADAMTRRELYVFDLYRVFEAAALTAVCFGPLAQHVFGAADPTIARVLALGYLFGGAALFLLGRRAQGSLRWHVALGLLLDLLIAATGMGALPGLSNAIATLLLVNVSAGALLLEPRLAFLAAALATSAVLGVLGFLRASSDPGAWLEAGMFGLGYFAATALCQALRRQVTETQQLVEQRELDLANLSQLNELIIRRMRTGVLVVDSTNRIHRINESAWHLLGNPPQDRRELGEVAPELSRRLYHWRHQGKSDSQPVALADGAPEVIPRFARLGSHADNVIVFLDDTSLLSRQAERLTLSSLGRLSASIAHEVRNPLAAISYSAQLLSESEELPDADQRLVEIIRAQCSRMNEIVENILQLSRREPSRPEPVELAQWVSAFVDEYRAAHPPGGDELRAVATTRGIYALVDPAHLHQVLWNLVQNALRHGRVPGNPARVTVVARRASEGTGVLIEVMDRGPGIPKAVAENIFEPFFTTHEFGTGLGLYLARQLCEANQATLEYLPVAGGGSCFRITMPGSGVQRAQAGPPRVASAAR